ncbi:MAG: hypothetical protein ACRD0S_07965, partial [Acidimicrobiales bacterium]
LGSGRAGAYVAWSDTRLGNADTSAQDIFGAVGQIGDDDSSVEWIVLGAEIVLIVIGFGLLVAAAMRRRRGGAGGGAGGGALSAPAT